jgi:hypothetical protein
VSTNASILGVNKVSQQVANTSINSGIYRAREVYNNRYSNIYPTRANGGLITLVNTNAAGTYDIYDSYYDTTYTYNKIGSSVLSGPSTLRFSIDYYSASLGNGTWGPITISTTSQFFIVYNIAIAGGGTTQLQFQSSGEIITPGVQYSITPNVSTNFNWVNTDKTTWETGTIIDLFFYG